MARLIEEGLSALRLPGILAVNADDAGKRSDYPFLDGLRAFAALLVVFSHLGNAGYFEIFGLRLSGTGRYGVWLFFVLSAFLLSRIMARSILARSLGADDIAVYFQRRFLRIYPLYAVYLFSVWIGGSAIAAGFGVTLPYAFDLDLRSVLAHLILSEGRGVTWTIAVEFQYYLILPAVTTVYVAALRRGRFFGYAVLLASVAASLAIWPGPTPGIRSLSPANYLSVFLLGSFLGVQDAIWNGAKPKPRARYLFGAVALVCWLLIAVATPDVLSAVLARDLPHTVLHAYPAAFALLWVGVVLGMLYGPQALRAPFETRVARYLGVISFGIYLLHPVVLTVVLQTGVAAPGAAWAIVLGATIVMAHLAHVAVERPFLMMRPIRPFRSVNRRAMAVASGNTTDG